MGGSCCNHDSPSVNVRHMVGQEDLPLTLSKSDRKKLEQIAAYLANSSKSNIKLRPGVLNGSRVSYFRGKHAVSALQESKVHSLLLSPPSPTHDDEDHPLNVHHHYPHRHSDKSEHAPATQEPSIDAKILHTLESMVLLGLILRVDKASKSKHLQITALQQFDPTEYHVLAHVPTSATHILASIGLVSIVLAGVMFPLWPHSLRQGVVYVSYALLAFLGILFMLAILRLILYCGLMVVGKPGWLFPNLFADVGILESFVPLWQWEDPSGDGKGKSKTE